MFGSSKKRRLESGEAKRITPKTEQFRRKTNSNSRVQVQVQIQEGIPRCIQRAQTSADLCHAVLMNDKETYTKQDVLSVITILEKLNNGCKFSYENNDTECSYIS